MRTTCLLFIFVVQGVTTMSTMKSLNDDRMMMIGHRGRSALFPENTRSSVASALESADGSEFDVQRTMDDILIILHDDCLARTALPWRLNSASTPNDQGSEVLGTCGLSRAAYLKLVNTPVRFLTFSQIKDILVVRPRVQQQ